MPKGVGPLPPSGSEVPGPCPLPTAEAEKSAINRARIRLPAALFSGPVAADGPHGKKTQSANEGSSKCRNGSNGFCLLLGTVAASCAPGRRHKGLAQNQDRQYRRFPVVGPRLERPPAMVGAGWSADAFAGTAEPRSKRTFGESKNRSRALGGPRHLRARPAMAVGPKAEPEWPPTIGGGPIGPVRSPNQYVANSSKLAPMNPAPKGKHNTRRVTPQTAYQPSPRSLPPWVSPNSRPRPVPNLSGKASIAPP